MDKDEYYMQLALQQAEQAKAIGEVPIGAIVVYQDEVIAMGFNQRETSQLASSHAEFIAIEKANQAVGSWRLENCTLYVTLEPCPMCAGAIVQSRVPRVVFGASDPKAGCAGTLMNLLNEDRFNHQATVLGGILEDDCGEILKDFFRELRDKKKRHRGMDN
ncbi:tRNA adenosine(34) deaminase TadA [Halobacillus shinanisalinarum]|uniref:tRNA-specific adenosine deaminase n=1 Tax=Halobacillus shinanisalinarum TaxID=2932258 RepID=A0ABY4H5Z1_9BACI|nr:tRNA adenosine(34) deaminase TadA [Halobacillus shinanisalinarum]UOQ95568.1 tRNA adenosine(34) deaminase TadA [Halobacillus shinanisalinarum]